MFDLMSVIGKAIKSISPGAVDINSVSDNLSGSDIVDIIAGSIDPLRAAKNLNLEVQASKSIAYYPIYASNALSIDTVSIISKSLERRIAEMIRLVISRNDFIDLKVSSKEQVIEQFRGQLFKGEITPSKDGKSAVFNKLAESEGFSVELGVFLKENYQHVMAREMVPVDSLYESGNLNAESVNFHLLEAKAAQSVSRAEHLKALRNTRSSVQSEERRAHQAKLQEIRKAVEGKFKERDSEYNRKLELAKGKMKDEIKRATEIDKRQMIIDSKKITKLNDIEPTVIEVDVVYGAEGAMKSTTVLLAIKCTVHAMESTEVARQIATTIYDERPAFRMIQVFAGEISFFNDFLLGIDKVKPAYSNSASPELGMFNHLVQSGKQARRINLNGASTNVIIPTTTLVITMDEVNQVQNICQENLMNGRTAKKFINILNIMNLFIIDEATDAFYRFDHAMGRFEKTSLPKEKEDNKNDGLVKALSLALTRR